MIHIDGLCGERNTTIINKFLLRSINLEKKHDKKCCYSGTISNLEQNNNAGIAFGFCIR